MVDPGRKNSLMMSYGFLELSGQPYVDRNFLPVGEHLPAHVEWGFFVGWPRKPSCKRPNIISALVNPFLSPKMNL